MTDRCYHFAGLGVRISAEDGLTYKNGIRMDPFAVESIEDAHVFRVSQAEKLMQPRGTCVAALPKLRVYKPEDCTLRYIGLVEKNWENAHICVKQVGKEYCIQLLASMYQGAFSEKTVLEAMGAEHMIVGNYGILLHCSYVNHGGKAILFTAPSGTGKSTQAELWKQCRNAEIINGDRAAVRIADGTILAEGVPFCGSSTYCENRSLPLEAIVYLAQAPRTTIRRMRGYEAFARVWEGVAVNTWDKGDMELASDTVKRIAENIPVYHMPCTPDESAVIALEQELRKLVNR